MAAARSAMDLFPDGIYVRLRSRVHETYLYADEDSAGLSLRPRSYVPAIAGVWRVHRVERDGIDYALLHGAAYGRYLALCTDKPPPRHCVGCRAVQTRFDNPALDAVMWRPVRVAGGGGAPPAGGRAPDYVLLRHIQNGNLRANGRFRIWNNGVSIDYYFGTRSTMRHWTVEVVPPRVGRPPLPPPTQKLLSGLFGWRTVPEADQGRVIWHLHSDQPLNFGPRSVPHFSFYGRSVFNLRTQLGHRANPGNVLGTLMCVREGSHGRLTPLVTDLANCNDDMNIVVYTTGAPDAEALVYPDVNA